MLIFLLSFLKMWFLVLLWKCQYDSKTYVSIIELSWTIINKWPVLFYLPPLTFLNLNMHIQIFNCYDLFNLWVNYSLVAFWRLFRYGLFGYTNLRAPLHCLLKCLVILDCAFNVMAGISDYVVCWCFAPLKEGVRVVVGCCNLYNSLFAER